MAAAQDMVPGHEDGNYQAAYIGWWVKAGRQAGR